MRLLIKNIKKLVGIQDIGHSALKGADMATIQTLDDSWLAAENGVISGFGTMSDWEGIRDWNDLTVVDADGKFVLPAWCDSHSHLVFAGSRETEFEDRIHGLTYEEIASRGGGILNSAKKLNDSTEDELYHAALQRLNEVASLGTGAIEIKSGYGLSFEGELKILRVIRRLKENSPVTIRATFLGAHAIPQQYKQDRRKYIDCIIHEMLPQIGKENLADYIDVFCETNYFTPEETDEILTAGAAFGLRPKIHVNQFTSIGGVQIGLKHHALSVDHLEVMRDEDLGALSNSNTIATILPSCSLFINIPFAPARSMLSSNIAVALASDYNPGSTPSGNMSLVVSLGCIRCRLTPSEAINAATINGACAMGIEKSLGSITIGKGANLILTKPMPSLAYLPYSFGSNLIEKTILNGEFFTPGKG